jgi:hypothetical protein
VILLPLGHSHSPTPIPIHCPVASDQPRGCGFLMSQGNTPCPYSTSMGVVATNHVYYFYNRLAAPRSTKLRKHSTFAFRILRCNVPKNTNDFPGKDLVIRKHTNQHSITTCPVPSFNICIISGVAQDDFTLWTSPNPPRAMNASCFRPRIAPATQP